VAWRKLICAKVSTSDGRTGSDVGTAAALLSARTKATATPDLAATRPTPPISRLRRTWARARRDGLRFALAEVVPLRGSEGPIRRTPDGQMIKGGLPLLLLGFHVGDQTRLKTQGYGGHPDECLRPPSPARPGGSLAARRRVHSQRPMLIDLDQSAPGKSSLHTAGPNVSCNPVAARHTHEPSRIQCIAQPNR